MLTYIILPSHHLPTTLAPTQCSYRHHVNTIGDFYATTNLSRGGIISKPLFCPVCQIFNHAAKHTHRVERLLKNSPRQQESLARYVSISNTQTGTIANNAIFRTLRLYLAQGISSLLKTQIATRASV